MIFSGRMRTQSASSVLTHLTSRDRCTARLAREVWFFMRSPEGGDRDSKKGSQVILVGS